MVFQSEGDCVHCSVVGDNDDKIKHDVDEDVKYDDVDEDSKYDDYDIEIDLVDRWQKNMIILRTNKMMMIKFTSTGVYPSSSVCFQRGKWYTGLLLLHQRQCQPDGYDDDGDYVKGDYPQDLWAGWWGCLVLWW